MSGICSASDLDLKALQGQGRAWLHSKEAQHGLAVAQLTDKTFRTVLEARCLSPVVTACTRNGMIEVAFAEQSSSFRLYAI